MEQFFRSIGSRLEHLSILGEVSSSKFLLQVKTLCRNVLHLNAENVFPDLNNALVDLVTSYSSQQEKFLLGFSEETYEVRELCLTLADYQRITHQCSNLSCSVFCDMEHSLQVMDGLEDRLASICLDGLVVPDAKSLQKASAKCTSLRENKWINAEETGAQYMKSIVPLVQGFVHTLNIDVFSSNTFDERTDPIFVAEVREARDNAYHGDDGNPFFLPRSSASKIAIRFLRKGWSYRRSTT